MTRMVNSLETQEEPLSKRSCRSSPRESLLLPLECVSNLTRRNKHFYWSQASTNGRIVEMYLAFFHDMRNQIMLYSYLSSSQYFLFIFRVCHCHLNTLSFIAMYMIIGCDMFELRHTVGMIILRSSLQHLWTFSRV